MELILHMGLPDNPTAKNVRFRIEGVKLINKVEVFMNNIKLFEVRK